MKKYTSRTLQGIAIVLLAFPVIYPLVFSILFDVPAGKLLQILLSPFFWLVIGVMMIAGLGLRDVTRWSWSTLLAGAILVIYENAIVVTRFGETHHPVVSFVLSIGILAALVLRVRKEVRVPYFLPKIRWWENDPNHRIVIPVTLKRSDESSAEAEIMDLSPAGCFIKTSRDFMADEPVLLQFNALGYLADCKGVVVWRAESTVTHPKGIGVMFTDLSRDQKRRLRVATRRLVRMYTISRSPDGRMRLDKILKKIKTSVDAKRKKLGSK